MILKRRRPRTVTPLASPREHIREASSPRAVMPINRRFLCDCTCTRAQCNHGTSTIPWSDGSRAGLCARPGWRRHKPGRAVCPYPSSACPQMFWFWPFSSPVRTFIIRHKPEISKTFSVAHAGIGQEPSSAVPGNRQACRVPDLPWGYWRSVYFRSAILRAKRNAGVTSR